MRNRRIVRTALGTALRLAVCLTVLLLSIGCDGSQNSSATMISPTLTPTPADTPTATPVPPTPTPTGTTQPATTSMSDRQVLEALYYTTGGANWRDNSNWLSSAPLGEWYGVTTDADGRVTELALYDNGLSGPIPAELGQLLNLEVLDLWGNGLSGPIPAELGQLFSLHALLLYDNGLSGLIPAELGQLSSLQELALSGNDFSGCVPEPLLNVAFNDVAGLGLPACS